MSNDVARPPVPPGRIDIHSHLLPDVDDGCADSMETIESIRRLMTFGYVGSICTPHIWPDQFAENTPAHIENWTLQLHDELQTAGVDYRLWPGGELRISQDAIAWMQVHGVPTLADSKCVLTDLWVERWPRWVRATFDWLVGQGLQPILAHPERMPPSRSMQKQLPALLEMGVWLQGNLQSFTGENGYVADRESRRLLAEGHYHFLALDLHRPDSLDGRLDGIQLVVEEFGLDCLDELTARAPRRDVLGLAD